MIGNNIKKLRLAKNWTQKDLAIKSSITRESIGNYERGDRIPPSDILNKIAAALEVPINRLLEEATFNLNDSDTEKVGFYIDVIIGVPELKPLIPMFKEKGYKLEQDMKGADIYLIKEGKSIAKISEKDFIEFGKRMLDLINEFTDFEFNRLIDIFTFLD